MEHTHFGSLKTNNMEVLIVLTIVVSTVLNLVLFFFIIIKLHAMAKNVEDFNLLLDQIIEKNGKIAADVAYLKGKLDDNGLTGTEEQLVYDRIQAALAALTATDDATPEPVPVPDPDPDPEPDPEA